MPLINCFRYIDQNIMPFADFLHSPTSFPITKQATKSYFGIFLSFIMICILIGLSILEIKSFNDNYEISYSQGFIKRKQWDGRIITFGFNVSEEWENKVSFELEDSAENKINFKKCNENLTESENGTINCLINYSLSVDNNASHVLKIMLRLDKNLTEYDRKKIPFTLLIKEPIINHDNKENPLETSIIERFTSFFNTNEITTFRRYLKYIKYQTENNFFFFNYFNKSFVIDTIYLEDFEDSRKFRPIDALEEEGNFLGSYRIMVSKKMDIYKREYKTLLNILSTIGGYYGTFSSIFSILCLLLVNPNDNYRIFDYLKKKNSIYLDKDLKSIYDDSKIKGEIEKIEFNEKILNNRWIEKFWNKFCYIFCRFFSCSKRVQPLSIVDQYIQKNLTIENYLESQILSKEILKNMDKIDELKAKYLNKYKRKKGNRLYTIIEKPSLDINDNTNIQPLMNDINIEMGNQETNRFSTVYIEKNNNISSFDEKQKDDIIRIVLDKIF